MIKAFRDPVHNLITFDKDIEELVIALINTPEMQRLRRIKQLGLSHIAYSGADHSRFSHSLGVAYLAQRVVDTLALVESASNREYLHELNDNKKLLVASALLHDIGHGPFSHAIEGYTQKKHEIWTTEIITNPESEVYKELQKHGIDVERVQNIIRRVDKSILVKIISSQLDADRFDYLLRDSLMCGVEYGKYDLEWILHSLRLIEIAGQPEVVFDVSKGRHAVEGYILSRFWMYQQVYYHKTSRGMEKLVENILKRAAACVDAPSFFANSTMRKLLKKEKIEAKEYVLLDDTVILYHFGEWQNAADKILSDLCKRFFMRELYKAREIDGMGVGKMMEHIGRVKDMARREGYEADYYVCVDEAKNVPYKDPYIYGKPVKSDGGEEEQEAFEQILVVKKDGKPDELSKVSDIIEAIRNKGYNAIRLYMPKEIRDKLDIGSIH